MALISINKLKNGFLYLQITRGTAKRNHIFPKLIKPNVIIFSFSLNISQIEEANQQAITHEFKTIFLLNNLVIESLLCSGMLLKCNYLFNSIFCRSYNSF